jgi:hypothetical protein
MDALILLDKLRTLLTIAPPLDGRGPYGHEQFAWLGRASSLIKQWDYIEASSFNVAIQGMTSNFNRTANHGIALTLIYKAIVSLEGQLPQASEQIFGPGAAYDFFTALRELVSSTEKSIFLIDPYMDAQTFDGYLSALTPGRDARLLLSKYGNDARVAANKFVLQHQCNLEMRQSHQMHDRVIFIDNAQCWVLGASIKDAAERKPTYLAPLSPDVAMRKLQIYEDIWNQANPI